MNQVVSPITQALKKNATNINLVLLTLVLLLLFPLNHFLPYDIKEKVETELKTLMENVWIKVFVSVLVFAVFQSGNINMLVLLLYLIHHIAIHQ